VIDRVGHDSGPLEGADRPEESSLFCWRMGPLKRPRSRSLAFPFALTPSQRRGKKLTTTFSRAPFYTHPEFAGERAGIGAESERRRKREGR